MQIADQVEAFVARHPELTRQEVEFMAQCLEVALARGVPMSIEQAHQVLLAIVGLYDPEPVIH